MALVGCDNTSRATPFDSNNFPIGETNMHDKQIKAFESKLRTAFKLGCAISAWSIDRGHCIGFQIKRGRKRYWADDFLASSLSTSHDVEVRVRAIANALPTSWRA